MLSIKKLHARVEGKEILKGINIDVKPGEIHAIMGPNGSGKSTLASVLAGNPKFEVTRGSIFFQGKDVLDMAPEERANDDQQQGQRGKDGGNRGDDDIHDGIPPTISRPGS